MPKYKYTMGQKNPGPPASPIHIIVKPGSSQTGMNKVSAVVVSKGARYYR